MASNANVIQALQAVDLFAGLSKRSLEKVASRVQTVQHVADKQIAIEGRSGVAFHLVQSGTAEVEVGGSVVGTLQPGDYFGELSLIDRKPRSATVRATSDMTTYSIVAWDFEPLLDDEPELTKALLLAMCARLRAAEAR
jgi:CRP-like cAMP-binding protein